jgi:hypothetical protein
MQYHFFKTPLPKRIRILDIALLLCGFILLFTPGWIAGMLWILTALIVMIVRKPEQFIVSDEGVFHITFRKKFYPWVEIEQVKLKDGMLTIDLLNNTLFQCEVTARPALPEAEVFNTFCKAQIAAEH